MANAKTTTSEAKDKDVIVRRLYARGKWKLNSVAHFGGDETGIADMCLLRDAEWTPLYSGSIHRWRGAEFSGSAEFALGEIPKRG